MTKTIRAHFDGRVIVPDDPVDVPMEVQVMLQDSGPEARSPARRVGWSSIACWHAPSPESTFPPPR